MLCEFLLYIKRRLGVFYHQPPKREGEQSPSGNRMLEGILVRGTSYVGS